MKSRFKLTKSERVEKAKKICELYSSGEFTIKSCCAAVGVDYSTFQHWTQPHLTDSDIESGNYRRGFVLDVHLMYKKAIIENDSNFKLLIKHTARQGLLLRITGTEYEEIQEEEKLDKNGNLIPVSRKRIHKRVLPDVTALIFSLKNLDKENFQEKVTHNLNGNIGVSTGFEHMTLSELQAKKRELEEQLNSDSDL